MLRANLATIPTASHHTELNRPNMSGRRVLLVTTDFPPNPTGGRFRLLKLVRLLPDFGWDPTVLTITSPIDADALLNTEIPRGSRVVRAWMPQIKGRTISAVKGLVGSPAMGDPAGNPPWRRAARVVSRCLSGAARRWMVPDHYVSWVPFALLSGLAICRRWKPEVVFTSAPGVSGFLLGYLLKCATGIPWVAEYRDLWTGDHFRHWVPPSRERFELRIERGIMRKADIILTVSERYREYLSCLHENGRIGRIRCVPNGADFTQAIHGESSGVVPEPNTFIHTGHLHDKLNPVEFFKAFTAVAKKYGKSPSAPRCILAGEIQPQVRRTLGEIPDHTGGGPSPFELLGELPHADSLHLQRSAFVLLLFIVRGPATEGVITGKLFEYIAAGRPILVVTDGGEAAEIIRRGRLGWITPYDTEAIRSLLSKIVSDPDRSIREVYQPDWEYLMSFDQKTMAARVADALSAASGQGLRR
jgi:glycosyltransferase involved in cell wall biosynthesis